MTAATRPPPDPREWGSAREMTAVEALMWRAEADPMLRSHVTAIEILDCVPDWQRLIAAHEWATGVVARLRQRVVEPSFTVGPPVWGADPQFDLGYHLRRVALPAPGGLRELLDLVQAIAMAPLDPSRPQWEATLVEGFEGDRAAYVIKLNHALTDGLGAVQLFELIHSRRREPTTDKLKVAPVTAERLTPIDVLGRQLAERVVAAPRDAVRAVGAAASLTAHSVRRPRRAIDGAVGYARSLGRVLGPPPADGSPLLERRSRSWWFGAHEVALTELKTAAKAAGGSVNDGFLAALLGAFRRYHDEFGVPIETMPVAIPISIRRDEHSMGGNRIAGGRLAAPVGEADPSLRIGRISELVAAARAEPAVNALGAIAPIVSRLPSPLLTRLGRSGTAANDLQASNVPGLRHDVYIAGAKVTRIYPFGPLPGCAAMVTMVSHAGICCIGANLDRAAITDPELFVSCLREGFDEVLSLAPRPRPTTPAKERTA